LRRQNGFAALATVCRPAPQRAPLRAATSFLFLSFKTHAFLCCPAGAGFFSSVACACFFTYYGVE